MARVAVLGAGSWGTAFAKVLSDAGNDVTLWARRAEVADAVARDHANPAYLPGVVLPTALAATSDHRVALDGADTVVLAIPSQSLRANLSRWVDDLPPDATLLSLAKGVELGSLLRMSEVVAQVTGCASDRVVVLSGPNLAREVAAEHPAAAVVACEDHDRAVAVQRLAATRYFRPYTNTDVVGCELGGAGKNVIALACGMAVGMGLGDNTTATLITRGLAEVTRLGEALGASPLTFAGLAGLGDLVATCASPLSRNRTFGTRLGSGDTTAQAQQAVGGQVAEGVSSCSSLRELAARHGADVPLTEGVHRVCHDGVGVRTVAGQLLDRTTRRE